MDLEPEFRSFLGKLGLVAVRAGMAEKAITVFLGLRALDPERVGPAIGLAQAYMADDRLAEAIVLLEQAADRDEHARLYLGVAYRLNREEARARDLWQALVDAGGETAEAAGAFLLVEEPVPSLRGVDNVS
ncbi:MAG: hypothetical protein LUC93_14580 [Planctomycetaceae bacterium]|nr:hypothetical protein [Planctomycetaceae bacterium]